MQEGSEEVVRCIDIVSGTRAFLIEELLETDKGLVDFFGSSKIGNGIGNRVMVFKAKQGRQLFLLKLIDADVHVM